MEESIKLLLEDLNPSSYSIRYNHGRPHLIIENENVIDTWSLTNHSGEYSYYIDEELYTYKLHQEIKSSPIDKINLKIKP